MSNSDFGQVKEILKEAAKENPAAYGGQRLWDFPLEKLLSAKLHDVPLIAPAQVKSCCGSNGSTEVASQERGKRSGLIKGLRGETPFDGSKFPALPWGGKPVSDENIQFICDWIDSGCPGQAIVHQLLEDETGITKETAVISEQIAGNQLEESTPDYQYESGEVKQRMNIDFMSQSQLEKLRYAFRELYKLNKWPQDYRSYNNQALNHQNHCQHGWEHFLPWHRIYMYEFELALQDRCPGVTMPYWDWTMPQYKPECPQNGLRIPLAFQAYLTEESLEFLKKHDIPTDNLEGLVSPRKYFATQTAFFDAVRDCMQGEYKEKYRNRFIDALLASNALWYPLRYPGQYQIEGKPSTINEAIHYHYPSADDMEEIMSLRTFRDFGGGSLYNDSYGFLDQNPHNTMHIWTGGMNPEFKEPEGKKDKTAPVAYDRNKAVIVAGRQFHTREDLYSQPKFGDMFSNLTTSYDTIFWPIHANVDRLWWEWQQQHPEAIPADLDAVLTPWSYTIRDTLDMTRFGYEYVKSTRMFAVGLEVPVGRFVSKAIDAPNSFARAEVRLHRVPQLLRSCFIRVFLNLPDANASTPLDNPHYGGYLAVFGHGACYGGPGHCDPAPLRRREYDLRPRDHNTPRNYRVNVTKCAKRLLEAGATTLQITLVVIGADYQEDHELLRLKGVSLNFLD